MRRRDALELEVSLAESPWRQKRLQGFAVRAAIVAGASGVILAAPITIVLAAALTSMREPQHKSAP